MRIDALFDNFDQLTELSTMIPSLRQLIFELAVRGRLSEQDPTDQYDSLWRELNAKLDATIGRTVSKDAPFQIPKGWRWVMLNEVGDTKPRNQAPDDTAASFVPMAFIPAEYGRTHRQERRIWGEIKKGYTHIAEGDLVLAKITPCFENRKSTVLQGLCNGTGAGTTELHVFRRDSDVVDPRYLLIYMKSDGFVRCGIPRMTGSAGQKRVPHDYFANSIVPLPPPREQKRIVAKVDDLIGLCDRLEAQLNERDRRRRALSRASLARFVESPTPANLSLLFHHSYSIEPEDLRKTVLDLAVQGKLVLQEARDEPARALIARITERRQAVRAKQYRAVDPDDCLYEIPESWSWVRLGNLSISSDAGWSPQCLPRPRIRTEWGVLKVSAVSWGEFRPDENKALPLGMTGRSACEVKAGDFLVSRANTADLVARSVVVARTPPHLMMSDKIVRFTFPDEVDKSFINLANSSSFARDYYVRSASGTSSSMKNISREVMCMLPIALPPGAEQRRIVAKVNQLMTLIDQLEEQISHSRTTATRLITALVGEAIAVA